MAMSVSSGPSVEGGREVTVLRVVNAVAFAAVYAATLLSSRGLIGRGSNSEVTKAHPTPITPAGYTFATVWTTIYLFQAVLFLFYQFLPSANRTLVFERIGLWHAAACACNVGWMVAFSYELMALQCVLIWALLACLAVIYLRINQSTSTATTWGERLCVKVPFSLYAAWVLVACIVDIFVTMPSAWRPADMTLAGIFSLASAGVLALAVLLWHQDAVFAGVVVWALAGVSNRPGVDPSVYGASIALAAVLGVSTIGALGMQSICGIILKLRARKEITSQDLQEPML